MTSVSPYWFYSPVLVPDNLDHKGAHEEMPPVDAAAQVSARILAIPALERFINKVEYRLEKGQEAFWDCVDDFQELLCSTVLCDLVNYELLKINTDPQYVPELASETQMTIVRRARYGLDLKIMPSGTPGAPRLYSPTEHFLAGVSAGTSATVELYEQPQPLPNEIFDPKRRLINKGTRHLSSGEVLGLRAGYDIFRFHGTNTAPIVLLTFSTDFVLRLRWEYDPDTLCPTRIIAADPMSSRLEFACKMLAQFGSQTSVAPLKHLAQQHPDHFVRWTALKNLLDLNFEEGLVLLQQAVNDPHPHVRNAAHRSLESLRTMPAAEAAHAQ